MILGLISRWHGSSLPPGKVIKSIAWAVPLAALVFVLNGGILLTLVALVLCALGKSTGHGAWFDLGTWQGGNDREVALEPLIKWLKPYLNQYDYEALGMGVVGFAAVFGAVVALCFVKPYFALLLGIAGFFKWVAYTIGWTVSAKRATMIGEFLTGLFVDIAILIILWMGDII